MQLPDEAIEYNYQGLLVPHLEEWTGVAELRNKNLLQPSRLPMPPGNPTRGIPKLRRQKSPPRKLPIRVRRTRINNRLPATNRASKLRSNCCRRCNSGNCKCSKASRGNRRNPRPIPLPAAHPSPLRNRVRTRDARVETAAQACPESKGLSSRAQFDIFKEDCPD